MRVAASGIRYTGIGYMRDAYRMPILPGHEGAGIVEAIGDYVQWEWEKKGHELKYAYEHLPLLQSPRPTGQEWTQRLRFTALEMSVLCTEVYTGAA